MKDKEHIIRTPYKSEVVCASLLESGNKPEQIKVNFKGAFKKSFSNDIEMVEVEENAHFSEFKLTINRNSIYDKLPEGLFHQTLGSGKVQTVQDAVNEHKRFKEEEKLARKFFAPVEQLIFSYRIFTEIAERQALYNLQNGNLNSSFYKFWGISGQLPKEESTRLLQLMPYENFIKGDKEATEIALFFILAKEVVIKYKELKVRSALKMQPALKETRLGINTVLGAETEELIPCWVINIKSISQKNIKNFVPDAPMGKLLHRFTEIFIPLDIDVLYEFETSAVAKDDFSENILGYGCTL